jgi:cellulose biosynthesis protein BcsQ
VCIKGLFRVLSRDGSGSVSLISGDINLTNIEADLYSVVRNKNEFTRTIPYRFEQSIRKHLSDYDCILIDTSPSASSIINALMVMLSDYWIAPVSPSFFSLQAIDNLSTIFKNWLTLL